MANAGINMEEEEEELQGTPEQESKPTGSAAKAGGRAAAPTPDDADFGDENEYRRPGELEFVKVEAKNTFARLTILINPANGKAFMKKGFVHYVVTKGYARCHSKRNSKGEIVGAPAFCCKQKEGEARYGALSVCYTNVDSKTGRFIKDKPVEFEIKALMISRIGYKDISLLPGLDDNEQPIAVTAVDITATPKEGANGLAYAKISKASYMRSDVLKAEVAEAIKPFLDGRELSRKVGKVLTTAEMRVHMGVGVGATDDAPGMDDLDD